MSLTDTQLQLIEEGLALAVAAVLAAVRKAGETPDGAPLDWSKLRITETPEMALEKAKDQSRAREQAGAVGPVEEKPPLPSGRPSTSLGTDGSDSIS